MSKYRRNLPPKDDDTTIIIKHSTSKPNVKFEPLTEDDYGDFADQTPSQLSVRTTINVDDTVQEKELDGKNEPDEEDAIYYPRAHRPKKKQYIPEPEKERAPFLRYKIELTDSDDDDDDYVETVRRTTGETSDSVHRERGYNVKHNVMLGNDDRRK